MDNNINYNFQILPRDQIECDGEQPRKDLIHSGLPRLQKSIERHGIQQPIAVTQYAEDRYRIIDGHRRYLCAKALDVEQIPCIVYNNLSSGELEIRRFEMQNVRRPWRPLERSDALHRMRKEIGFKSIREMAAYMGISAGLVADSLRLREQQLHLLSRLESHGLSESFQYAFVNLKPHLCKVAELEVDELIDELLWRITKADQGEGKITNAKELRTLKSAFIRFSLNESALTEYFTDRSLKVRQLEERILRSGHAADVERVISWYAGKLSINEQLTTEEASAIDQLVSLRLREREGATV